MSEIIGAEYSAQKEDIKLHIFRKHLASAPEDGSARPILFLVHGSSFAGVTGHDLQVSGREDYSAMNAFARLGYDVWSMDHEGYGFSAVFRCFACGGLCGGLPGTCYKTNSWCHGVDRRRLAHIEGTREEN